MNRLHQKPLPSWLVNLLACPPEAGAGVHSWAFKCAKGLAPWRPPHEAITILTQASKKCSRTVPQREIEDAIKNARSDWKPETEQARLIRSMGATSPYPRVKTYPDPDWTKIAAIARSGRSISHLAAASPTPPDRSAGEIISMLWHGNPLLCLAKRHPADAVTKRRSEWLSTAGGISDHSLIVPSPMISVTGTALTGQPSVRCLDNTGPRWFLVVEFDFKPDVSGKVTPVAPLLSEMAAETPPRTAPDLCAAILLYLLEHGAPLVLAVHSGGKSIHGWFPTHGADDEALWPFFTTCCSYGADPATWSRCQMIRLPAGTRGDDTPQRILYFNPALIHAA